ncbi:MAG: hypothetical protein L6U99_06820 [Clostridium sp.]|nr:MAG: hypothetical protein L6U99_06820 [Clostridium sp.]
MKKKNFLIVIMFVFSVFWGGLLVACNRETSGAKSITNLTYNGETITWSSVKKTLRIINLRLMKALNLL